MRLLSRLPTCCKSDKSHFSKCAKSLSINARINSMKYITCTLIHLTFPAMTPEKHIVNNAILAVGWYIKHGSDVRRLVPVDLKEQVPKPLAGQGIPMDEDGIIQDDGHLIIPSPQWQVHLN